MIATKPQPATQRKPFYAANINAPIDNDLMSIEELVAKLNRGSQAIKEGKGIALRTKEESRSYLLSL
ncbi:MAG: hypothetical protein LBT94_01185 [Prevotellaceae bacterium]|jgi:hypothetical protein|nr:hypothetical protein [Prevotellaceae bacterium]